MVEEGTNVGSAEVSATPFRCGGAEGGFWRPGAGGVGCDAGAGSEGQAAGGRGPGEGRRSGQGDQRMLGHWSLALISALWNNASPLVTVSCCHALPSKNILETPVSYSTSIFTPSILSYVCVVL